MPRAYHGLWSSPNVPPTGWSNKVSPGEWQNRIWGDPPHQQRLPVLLPHQQFLYGAPLFGCFHRPWSVFQYCEIPLIQYLRHSLLTCTIIITGPPNGPVLICSSVTLPAGQPGACERCRRSGRPTLHGGPVVLRPVRATPCCLYVYLQWSVNVYCIFLCWHYGRR